MSQRRRREMEELLRTVDERGNRVIYWTVAQIVSLGLMVFGVLYLILRLADLI